MRDTEDFIRELERAAERQRQDYLALLGTFQKPLSHLGAFEKSRRDHYSHYAPARRGAPWADPFTHNRPTRRRVTAKQIIIGSIVLIAVLTMLVLFIAQLATNPIHH
ncbi:hypothetical protein [Mycolicibacterium sphagni]|uniref:Uncharacterized protein n=1 Tax=Mycolicibacterium sphagni TaxID=1786 RepID=A0A255DQS4_9MYCO|nr:hypothetical protein [Mycolicibacterium sphagni]OYN81799.1 hypothetical protein CG716_05510 [Mycolicibacterium sphagni]